MGNTGFHVAASYNYLDIISLVLAQGTDINIRDAVSILIVFFKKTFINFEIER